MDILGRHWAFGLADRQRLQQAVLGNAGDKHLIASLHIGLPDRALGQAHLTSGLELSVGARPTIWSRRRGEFDLALPKVPVSRSDRVWVTTFHTRHPDLPISLDTHTPVNRRWSVGPPLDRWEGAAFGQEYNRALWADPPERILGMRAVLTLHG